MTYEEFLTWSLKGIFNLVSTRNLKGDHWEEFGGGHWKLKRNLILDSESKFQFGHWDEFWSGHKDQFWGGQLTTSTILSVSKLKITRLYDQLKILLRDQVEDSFQKPSWKFFSVTISKSLTYTKLKIHLIDHLKIPLGDQVDHFSQRPSWRFLSETK